MIRNLYYNCCPFAFSEHEWRDNVRMLCRYGDIFNGRRIVVIRTGEGMSSPEDVMEAFGEHDFYDVDYRLRPNDPELHETANFIETLEALESLREDEVTFYAHSKGVRLSDPPTTRIQSVRQWRNRMYHECLHDEPKIDAVLSHYAAAGCFLLERDLRPWTKWMFCGTFFWFNHKAIFSNREWRYLGPVQDRFSVENYLGVHLERKQVFCLYGREVSAGQLYAKAAGYFRCRKCGNVFRDFLKKSAAGRKTDCCQHHPLTPPELLCIPEMGEYDADFQATQLGWAAGKG